MHINILRFFSCTDVRQLLFQFVFIGFAVSACTFDPEEEYFKDVEQPLPSSTAISFFSMKDTVDFRGMIDLNIHASSQMEIVRHRLTLNGAVVAEQNGPPYAIHIDSRKYPDGLYELKLTLTKRVIGESLAAKFGLELQDEELTRKVYIYNAPISKPEMYTTVDNGVLVLHWKPYTGRGFKKYTVTGTGMQDQLTITDVHQSGIPIENYVGGTASFSMNVFAFNEMSSEHLQFVHSLNVSITRTATGIHVSWDESPFVNYDGAQVQIQNGSSYDYVELTKDQRSLDYDLAFIFPYHVGVLVSGYSKARYSSGIGFERFTSQVQIGNFGGEGPVDIFKTSRDTVMLTLAKSVGSSVKTKTLALVNTNTGLTLASKRGSIGISQNGQLAYEFRDKTTLMRIDPNTLEYVQSINVGSHLSDVTNVLSVYVSNGNAVMLFIESVIKGKPTEYWVYAIDCATNQLLYRSSVYNELYLHESNGKLSDNGRMFYQYSNVVKLDQSPVTLVTTFEYSSPYYQIGLLQRQTSIKRLTGTGYLREASISDPSYKSVLIDYPKDVRYIFSSNDNTVIGVGHAVNGLLNIDFIEEGTLKILGTLSTTFDKDALTGGSPCRAFIIGRSFYIYSPNSYNFYKHDF